MCIPAWRGVARNGYLPLTGRYQRRYLKDWAATDNGGAPAELSYGINPRGGRQDTTRAEYGLGGPPDNVAIRKALIASWGNRRSAIRYEYAPPTVGYLQGGDSG